MTLSLGRSVRFRVQLLWLGAREGSKLLIQSAITAAPQRFRNVFIRSLKRFIRGAFFLSLGTFATSMLIRC